MYIYINTVAPMNSVCTEVPLYFKEIFCELSHIMYIDSYLLKIMFIYKSFQYLIIHFRRKYVLRHTSSLIVFLCMSVLTDFVMFCNAQFCKKH